MYHACFFGEVETEAMKFTEPGENANNIWHEISPPHFPCAELGVNQVKPNQVHGIIIINEKKVIPSGVDVHLGEIPVTTPRCYTIIYHALSLV